MIKYVIYVIVTILSHTSTLLAKLSWKVSVHPYPLKECYILWHLRRKMLLNDGYVCVTLYLNSVIPSMWSLTPCDHLKSTTSMLDYVKKQGYTSKNLSMGRLQNSRWNGDEMVMKDFPITFLSDSLYISKWTWRLSFQRQSYTNKIIKGLLFTKLVSSALNFPTLTTVPHHYIGFRLSQQLYRPFITGAFFQKLTFFYLLVL